MSKQNKENTNNELCPELTDIIEMIRRYCAANKNQVAFVGHFIAMTKENKKKNHSTFDHVDDKKSTMIAYGHLDVLRDLTNMCRDLIEDEVDEEGFVNY